ncbi:Acyl-coenzyme A thioesterase 13 [Tolypocladium paradoxum]|uniref:Acyl-coenzyme A thioesterase 13 n=1 Tax=Tolypocladium paradoxum TaxID=94208 RepID=A0A2S4KRJ2_9HYPO|nr:Acyl-coenzyme A thioesterase 13 [Tolypocladium paradoxum]
MASLPPQPDQPENAAVVATRTAHVQSLLERLLANSPIYGLMLSTIRLVSVTRGTVTTALTLTPTHVNSKGGLHGAVSAVIIDFTTGLAIASRDLRDATGASVDMHISYLSSARVGDDVRIETRAERVGGSLAFVTVRIGRVDEGGETLVTLGQHTKYVRGTAPATPQGMTPA